MEVAMTRTAIRHTLSAFAAAALVSVFVPAASDPGAAQGNNEFEILINSILSGSAAKEAAEAQKYTADQQSGTKAKTPKGASR
jgi:hypothetical protein